MSEISDQELRELLGDLGELEDVPDEVSKRLDGTIQQLLMQEISKSKEKKFSWGNLALAASFVLTIGLGASFLVQEVSEGNTETSIANRVTSPQFEDDEVLTSQGSEIARTDVTVRELNSGLDYSKLPTYENLPFTPEANYGSFDADIDQLKRCLTDLGLIETVSLIDRGFDGDEQAISIWSATSQNSWRIVIIDDLCNPIREFIYKR